MVVPARGGIPVERELHHQRRSRERRCGCKELSSGETCFSHD
jgi:hypothetical protein